MESSGYLLLPGRRSKSGPYGSRNFGWAAFSVAQYCHALSDRLGRYAAGIGSVPSAGNGS